MIIQEQIRVLPRIADIHNRIKYDTVSARWECMFNKSALPNLTRTAQYDNWEYFTQML
ncbi:MAG: hypothetical protein NPIRA05_03290 [Nitrospirales bacterium]|nr:MAG: hypothetical protein NPIRA05_03290 [Nitrospirales bacterium]